jgi:hypothetical protein
MEANSFNTPLREEFSVSAVSPEKIRGVLQSVDRSLVF